MSLVWQINLPDSQKIVLLALADCANDEGTCWPSIATLAKKCSKSERTVQGVIRELVEAGHLTRIEKLGKGCLYTIHPRSDCTPANVAPPQPLPPTPAAAAPKPSRTIIGKEANASSPERARANPDEFPCPEGVDPIDWQALKANRKAKRAPLTEGAYRQIVRKLDGWARSGWPPGPIIANAAERGWTTVFETDEMKGQGNGRTIRAAGGPGAADRRSSLARAIDEGLEWIGTAAQAGVS
jgi:hypothetical protein